MTHVVSDPQMCRQCGGLCCQGHAGIWVDPQRFIDLFCEGKVPEADMLPEGTILRDLGGVQVPAPITVEHGCIYLGADGCQLDETKRPCQCLALQPAIETLMEGEMHCKLSPKYGSNSARKNWSRFWDSD